MRRTITGGRQPGMTDALDAGSRVEFRDLHVAKQDSEFLVRRDRLLPFTPQAPTCREPWTPQQVHFPDRTGTSLFPAAAPRCLTRDGD